jgi:glutamine amidotransferase
MIRIVDYGVGNIQAFMTMFKRFGLPAERALSPSDLADATRLILPGVGHFDHAMQRLNDSGMRPALETLVMAKFVPVVGICVGMQILFRDGDENSSGTPHVGVDIWHESVSRIKAPILPHMGWNTVEITGPSKIFRGVENEAFYFVHSYAAKKAVGQTQAWVEYGEKVLAAIEDGAVCATQFHPEKSGQAGLRLIKNWVESI